MKCKICSNENSNIALELKEMMYGFRDSFDYFECAACGCIQIKNIPGNIEKYYPGDYYSYNKGSGIKAIGFLKKLQWRMMIAINRTLLSKLFANIYQTRFYQLLKRLHFPKPSSAILDVGSGSGEYLKYFYNAGFSDLTGIDPYLPADIIYNEQLRIEKKQLSAINRQYQVIMLNHSLEHMDDQLNVLKKLHSILLDDGMMLIQLPVVSKALMQLYGPNVVSLDAPRHFYIHTRKSISLLLEQAGFVTESEEFNAYEFSFWASEQYQKGISLYNDPNSFLVKKIFTDEQIATWKIEADELNRNAQSDNLALYVKKRKRIS